jgi:hypothetical protein
MNPIRAALHFSLHATVQNPIIDFSYWALAGYALRAARSAGWRVRQGPTGAVLSRGPNRIVLRLPLPGHAPSPEDFRMVAAVLAAAG